MSSVKVLLLDGPNLDALGRREPHRYGTQTLEDVRQRMQQIAKEIDVTLACFQSPSEGELVARVHRACLDGFAGCVINAGAFTHTSVALRDALSATKLPFVEVHITNPYRREPFRRRSLLSDLAAGVVCGLGVDGYEYGLRGLHRYLSTVSGSRLGRGV